MGRKNTRNDFFRSADLKLQREVEAKQKEVAKERGVDSGFLKQIRKTAEVAPRLRKEQAQHRADTQYRGADVVGPQPSVDVKITDPTESEGAPGDTGFIGQSRVNHFIKGLK